VLDATQKQMMQRTDLLQMKMEQESIMAECRVRPRRFEDVLAELETQVQLVPEFAKEAIYAKPIGTIFVINCTCGTRYEAGTFWNKQKRVVQCRTDPCPRCDEFAPKSAPVKRTKKARNLSIRAAEAIAEVYGFNRVRSQVEIIDSTHVKVIASFFDYAKLRSWISEVIISKVRVNKWKQTEVIPDDRFYGTVVKAEQSKVIREAILRSVPAALKLRLFAIAERVSAAALTDDEVDKIVTAFSSREVALEQIEGFLGKTKKEGWSKRDRQELIEAWNAIDQDEASVSEIFGDISPPERPKRAPKKTEKEETKEPEPEKVTGDSLLPTMVDETKEADSLGSRLQAARDRFLECKTIKSCGEMETELIGDLDLDTDKDYQRGVINLGELARERIREAKKK
jgi:hypothetical protein